MSNNIILVGNPNVGKTTLFNTLTNSNEKASNWHGVTVGIKSKQISYKNRNYIVNDLPGMYSLQPNSGEEKIAVEYLKNHKDDLLINICDANNLKRNLILTVDLIKNGYNIVVAVNMSNELNCYNYKKLSEEFGVSIIPIDARFKKGIKSLLNLVSLIADKKLQNISKTIKKQVNITQIINNIENYTVKDAYKIAYKRSDKIDKVLLNKSMFFIVFISTLFSIFYITFGPIGGVISQIFGMFFNYIFNILRKIISCLNISIIIKSLFIDGVIAGIESVVSFIPQIALLMLLIGILEDIGFMSRVAFMFDGLLKKFGLSGKSLFSLMMGYGCTTSAVLTTRNLENNNLRKRTVFLLPFMSCSAKLPIFLVISSLFFDKYKYLFVFGLYVFAIIVSLIFACIYKKVLPDKNDYFLLEMPKYRLPNLKKVLKDTLVVIYEFLIKIGTLILFFTVIIWILQNFTFDFQFLNGVSFEKSMLYSVSNKLVFLFKPLGFNSVGIIVALLLGVVAKEMIVVGLAMINGVSGITALNLSLINPSSICNFSPVTAIVFLVFVLIYSPCLSAILTIKNELGRKSALYVFVSQFLLAYLISFLVYKMMVDVRFIFAILLFVFLDILLFCVLRLKGKKKCWGNCNACRKI